MNGEIILEDDFLTSVEGLHLQDCVRELLYHIEGDACDRSGLKDTPKRVIKSFAELYGGYQMDPEEILERTFEEDSDQMVIVRDIPFYSQCEHHMIPFFGTADVGYLPDERVVGLSKLARLVDCFARRLQVQERMTKQISEAIQTHLKPKGVMVVIKAEHLCMCARGIRKPGAQTITSAITGAFLDTPSAKEEFMFLTDVRR